MEKLIIIKNCTQSELKTILNDWLVMYADDLKSKLIFEFAEMKPNVFVLKMDKSIDDTKFFFLVNYFAYPIDFEKTFEAEGYAMATKHKKFLNKNIYVFNNEQQDDCDNVWITTEDNETYTFDFAGKIKKMEYENEYKQLNISDLSTKYEQIMIDKKQLLETAKRKEEEKSKRNLDKRFKVISTVLFVGIVICWAISKYVKSADIFWTIELPVLLVLLWFCIDYKIFKHFPKTLICILLALLCVVLGTNTRSFAITLYSTLPLSSTTVMYLANRLLGAKLDKISDSRWDRFFLVLLFIFSMLISFFVFTPILKKFFILF